LCVTKRRNAYIRGADGFKCSSRVFVDEFLTHWCTQGTSSPPVRGAKRQTEKRNKVIRFSDGNAIPYLQSSDW